MLEKRERERRGVKKKGGKTRKKNGWMHHFCGFFVVPAQLLFHHFIRNETGKDIEGFRLRKRSERQSERLIDISFLFFLFVFFSFRSRKQLGRRRMKRTKIESGSKQEEATASTRSDSGRKWNAMEMGRTRRCEDGIHDLGRKRWEARERKEGRKEGRTRRRSERAKKVMKRASESVRMTKANWHRVRQSRQCTAKVNKEVKKKKMSLCLRLRMMMNAHS